VASTAAARVAATLAATATAAAEATATLAATATAAAEATAKLPAMATAAARAAATLAATATAAAEATAKLPARPPQPLAPALALVARDPRPWSPLPSPRASGCLTDMSVPNLRTDRPQDDILQDHIHSATVAAADPNAAVVAPIFDSLIADWKVKEDQRIQFVILVARAAALAYFIDTKLDAFVALLVNVLERLNKDRSSALWFSFFKGVAPSIFAKPILSGQLAKQRLWLKTLADSKHPELNALVPVLQPLLQEAGDAEAAVAQTKQDLLNFKTVGGWADHITLANASRTDAYGTLLDVPHQHPELKLPADYAEMFYLHDTSRRPEKPKTSAELKKDLAKHDEDRKLLEKAITDAEQREADEAKHEADLEAKQRELDAIEERSREDEARRKQLQEELAKGKKKK
jgi:hypothetical protein